MFLRRLSFKNFKALEDATFELAPLTVLIGPNNAGKSTVLQGLALLAQTAQDQARLALLLSGGLVDMGDQTAALVTRNARRADAFEIGLNWTPSRSEVGRYDRGNAPEVSLRVRQSAAPRQLETKLSVSFETSGKGKAVLSAEYPQAQRTSLRIGSTLEHKIHSSAPSPLSWPLQPTSSWSAEASEAGIPNVEASALAEFSPFFQQGLRDQLSIFDYVGPDRHVTSSSYETLPGPSANPRNAAQVVNTLNYQREVRMRVSSLCRDIFNFGIDTQAVPPQKVALVAVDANGHSLNAVNMGTGLTQLAWIALHLELTVERAREQTMYSGVSSTPMVGVEEPELHLHPRLQGQVAKLLADFLQRGQVLCTTQSEHFLIAILQFVLEGRLAASDVAVYFVENGRPERLEVDARGRLSGGLRGFFEANEEELLHRLDTLVGAQKRR
ncbi:MAG: AAA family ATPase [Chloroflexota bacterium]|nr:AAA family ATPase [Chloroflexota bacterium]